MVSMNLLTKSRPEGKIAGITAMLAMAVFLLLIGWMAPRFREKAFDHNPINYNMVSLIGN